MRVVVTRPEREAQRWVRELRALGLVAQALPLIEIAAIEDRSALQAAARAIGQYVGVMFVSGPAVEHFFSSNPDLGLEFSAQHAIQTRAWATGPGTARALLAAGVAPERIDSPSGKVGQFDSEALWALVRRQVHHADRVLIVRGTEHGSSGSADPGNGRDWFAGQVRQLGAIAEFVAAYTRRAPKLSRQDLDLACECASDGSVWLFTSSQALANLLTLVPDLSWKRARALATHPRIAQSAREAGFGQVQHSRATPADVAMALEQHFKMAR